jgi:restriction endonuclease S subunit
LVKRGAVGERFDADYQKLVNSTLFKFKYPLISIESLFFVRDGDHNKFPEEEYSDENNGIRYLRVQDIKEGKIISDRPIYVSKQYYNTIKRSHVKSGYVLFSIMASVGSIAIYPDGADDCTANRAVGILVPKSEKIISHYFQAFCDTEIGQKLFETLKKGGVQQRLNLFDVNKLKIPVPPIDIQSQIVAIYVQAYETKRQKEAEAKALLDSIEDYLLKSLGIILPEKVETKSFFYTRFKNVQGNRFDPFYHRVEFEILGKAISNSDFENIAMRNILTFLESGSRPSGGVSQYENGILSLGGEHVNNKCEIEIRNIKFIPVEFHLKNLKTETQINDILLVKDGATTGKIGIITENSHVGQNINEHVFMMRFVDSVNCNYILFLLATSFYQKLISRIITGATVTGLTKEVLNNLQIPLPPLSIQNEIAQHIRGIRAKAKALENEAQEILEKAKIEIEKMILGK